MIHKKLLFKSLEAAPYGEISVKTPEGTWHHFQGNLKGPSVDLELSSWEVPKAMLSSGDIGAGETYMEGLWNTSDLPRLLIYAIQNEAALSNFMFGRQMMQWIQRFLLGRHKNTLKRSPKNISKHYDLGNDFYQLWLDKEMNYSSALFQETSQALSSAQVCKHTRILSEIGGNSNQKILEIGCGWGSFVQHALQKSRHITAITLSNAQADYCHRAFPNSIQKKQLDIQLADYRHIQDSFDAIVSIEMFEAVGHQYWQTYFQSLKRCLKTNGTAVLQAITIADELVENYKNNVDFIRKHIFPGGFLPSDQQFRSVATQAGLCVKNSLAFGESYVKTLLTWLERFDAAKKEVLALGFDERFIRKWRFYLAYCAAGFDTGRTNVWQYTLTHKVSTDEL